MGLTYWQLELCIKYMVYTMYKVHGLYNENLLLQHWASLLAQRVKRLSAMRETWVRFLGREDTLEKEMATHSSILTWRIPWTEEPGGLQPTESWRVGYDWVTSLSLLQHREFYSIFSDDLNGKEIQKRGYTYIHITDSLSRTIETDTAL